MGRPCVVDTVKILLVPQKKRISQQAERLSASEIGLCSMKLDVSCTEVRNVHASKRNYVNVSSVAVIIPQSPSANGNKSATVEGRHHVSCYQLYLLTSIIKFNLQAKM